MTNRIRASKPVCHFTSISFHLRGGLPHATVVGVEDHPHISPFEARHCINTSAVLRIKYSRDGTAVQEIETLNTIYRREPHADR